MGERGTRGPKSLCVRRVLELDLWVLVCVRSKEALALTFIGQVNGQVT